MSNWAPEQAVLALRLQPSNVELISLVASARMQEGDRKGALKVLRRALKIAPSDASLYSRLGSVLASGGALSELPAAELRLLTKVAGAAAALRPSDAALHYNLGLAHAASGELARAAAAYRGALALRPASAEAYLGLAATQSRDDAVATLITALHAAPNSRGNANVLYNLGNALAQPPARGAEAVACFERAAVLQPSHVDAHYNAALAAQQAHIDEPAVAEAAYRRALALAPRAAKVAARLVSTLDWAGRPAEAAALARDGVAAGVWLRAAQRPSHLVPALAAAPWHDANGYAPALAVLRAAHDGLLREWRALHDGGAMRPQPEGLQERGQRWVVFDLGAACDGGGGGGKLKASCEALDMLRRAGEGATPPFAPLKAQLSTMAAGVHVRPHTGPTNAKLTLHYGLDVPRGGRIRVGDETRAFEPRKLLAFDDSFEHEVWQDADADRTVLVLHVRHPQLTTSLDDVARRRG